MCIITRNNSVDYLYIIVFTLQPFPASATTLHFEFYAENPSVSETSTTAGASLPSTKKIGQTNLVTYIHIENIDELGDTPAQIMNDLLKVYNVPQERQVRMFRFYLFVQFSTAEKAKRLNT